MGKLKRKIKKMSLYKKSMIIFTLVCLILGEIFLIYVNNALVEYEVGDEKSYMEHYVEDMASAAKKGNIDKYIELSKLESDYEKKSNLKKGYEQLFEEAKEVTFKKTDDKSTYDVFADEVKVATVELESKGTKHKLGLLTYDEYDTKKVTAYNKDGLYAYDIYVPDDYTLYINDTKVKSKDLKESAIIPEYEEVYELVDLPKLNHYEIKNLSTKPEIKVLDEDDKEVKLKKEGATVRVDNYFTTDNYDEAKKYLKTDYDPLEFAKNWSLFLTADLGGPSYGLYKLTPNLIEGTAMYQRAYNWATQVDITFTSIHSLDPETFTNTKVSNYTIYNENAFSVEVYLEKNLTLIDGQKRKDVLHDIFYYVWYEDAYRLVKMTSVTEE